ncbi:DegT/DnrJ/EryC1/StrS family aminotransferase [Akkermansiaceae bacterium]|nr:DegT/DnrJ/EryC1/StrS family aminotransferase [Akkermansiaceae bacterium]
MQLIILKIKSMSKLAIFGGKPIREKLFKAYNTIGFSEIFNVIKVMKSGVLSQFIGAWHKDFYGGPMVQKFEKKWAEKAKAKFAVSVNSNTSGLITALGAANVRPSDEVIVSPWSICASATAPMFWGGIPVFADIDPTTFCISPKSIREKITPRTKVILVVHIMGYPAQMNEIMAIAKEFNLVVIEDCAQCPFGVYQGKPLGSIGDMGVFSTNYHKHIHTGEGGIITTNSEYYNERCQLIRNHGEAVVEDKGVEDKSNIVGFNFRMGEIEAAIGIEQIKKFDSLQKKRLSNANYLIEKLKDIEYLDLMDYKSCYCLRGDPCRPCVSKCSHSYYIQPILYLKEKNNNIHRDIYLKALSAELPSSFLREDIPLIGGGYVKPLYLLPIFKNKLGNFYNNDPENYDYSLGSCPVVENLHFEKFIGHEFMRPSMSRNDLDDVVKAFYKVDDNMNELLRNINELS